jgi:hypothetical protein
MRGVAVGYEGGLQTSGPGNASGRRNRATADAVSF